MAKQWVQHISGQGEKWEVLDGKPPGLQNDFRPMGKHEWIVRAIAGSEQYVMRWFALPKSEYRLCDPPEVWRDVTGECEVSKVHGGIVRNGIILYAPTIREHQMGYRLRKVRVYPYQQPTEIITWAFIVEQQVTE